MKIPAGILIKQVALSLAGKSWIIEKNMAVSLKPN